VKRETTRVKSENPSPPITHYALRITKWSYAKPCNEKKRRVQWVISFQVGKIFIGKL